jgi:hypothetical protein
MTKGTAKSPGSHCRKLFKSPNSHQPPIADTDTIIEAVETIDNEDGVKFAEFGHRPEVVES